MTQAEIFHIVAIICFAISALCLAAAVAAYFKLGIAAVIGDITGRTARKQIEEYEARQEGRRPQTGRRARTQASFRSEKFKSEKLKSEKLKSGGLKPAAVSSGFVPSTDAADAGDSTEILAGSSAGGGSTEILAATGVADSTEILMTAGDGDSTEILTGSPAGPSASASDVRDEETALLSGKEQSA
ncbi:hypothetical protein [Gallibacter sp. Marseille-QA0791]|uniref:hypothetical protein n=1 Tax=Gallibacter sp. Marseille-QA0791 TaxID=3378781 RepID=UPI003A228A36